MPVSMGCVTRNKLSGAHFQTMTHMEDGGLWCDPFVGLNLGVETMMFELLAKKTLKNGIDCHCCVVGIIFQMLLLVFNFL